MSSHSRLPRSFHKSFKPERQYLAAIIKFAAAGREGTFQEIAACTGIPMGSSSGKVPAILDYARAMGLVKLDDSSVRSSTKKPHLTDFGRVVLQEDPFLKCEVTQWLAHLNMCSPRGGADAWYHCFFAGAKALGMEFPRKRLDEYLRSTYGVASGNVIGPLIGMYSDEAAFATCGALKDDRGSLRRAHAPLSDEFGLGLGAWMLHLISVAFPGKEQVPVTELEREAGWRSIPGWRTSDAQAALDLLVRKQCISVDRHMDPWLITPLRDPGAAWNCIYDDLI